MPPTTAFPALASVLQNAANANGNGTTMTTTGLAGVWLQVTGTFSATLTAKGTVDGNFAAIPVINMGANPPAVTPSLGVITAAGLYYLPLGGIDQIQVPVSGYASGTVTVTAEGTLDTPSVSLPVTTTATTGATTAVITGTAANGLSKAKVRNLAATVTAVKAGAGTLYELTILNTTGAACYVQVFDLATGSVTLGTTTPDREYLVAAGAELNVPIPALGIPFGTAISVASTTTEGGLTGSAAGVMVWAGYQ